MVELFIEGLKVDLSEDIAADITYSLADIRTPDKRQVNFTKTLTLIGTAKNDFIFGYIYDIDVENPANDPAFPNVGVNYTPKKLAKAILIADGIQVFDGTLRLWKIIRKNGGTLYEISLFGKLFDLFGELGEQKLTDLDFSDLNHAVTWGNIVSTWGEDFDYAFRYPLIDYGVNPLDAEGRISTIKLGSLVPCIGYKVYLDRIFSSNGGQYVLNFADRTIFDKMIVTPPKGIMSARPNFVDMTFSSTEVYTPNFYNNVRVANLTFTNTILTVVPQTSSHGKVSQTYKINTAVSTSFQFQFDLETTGSPTFGGVPTKNGLGVYFTSAALGTTVLLGNYFYPLDATGRQIATIEVPQTDYAVNDYFSVIFNVNTGSTFVHRGGGIKAISPADDGQYPILAGVVYDMANSVPVDIKQTDFVKDFIKLFNLFVTQDPDDKSIFIFTPQTDFYKRDISQVIDWTDKIDHSEEITFTPMSQLTAKEYTLSWKPDKDHWNELYTAQNKEVYGQVTYISDTDIIANKEKIEMLFSPAIMTRLKNSSVLCPAIYKMELVAGVMTRKPDKFNSRLLIWGGTQDAGHSIHLLNFNGTEYGNVSVYPFAGHIDNPEDPSFDLNFGNVNAAIPTATVNQFSRYWGRGLREAASKDGKLVSCSMYLKPEDIEALDFAALYKVSFQYFRLNKIEGFNPFSLGTSKVELIKVITL